MPAYDYRCQRCHTLFEERHPMSDIPETAECPDCGSIATRQFAAPAFSAKGDDLNGGKPQYCPGLARRMPFGKPDPKAYFASKSAARDAARRKADTGDYTVHFD